MKTKIGATVLGLISIAIVFPTWAEKKSTAAKEAKIEAPKVVQLNKSFKFETFKDAEKAKDKVAFTIGSRKVGVLTTHHTGYVKDGNFNVTLTGNTFSGAVLKMDPKSLDTDNGSRNEKMWSKCFETDKYKTLQVLFPNSAELVDGNYTGTVPAMMTVRDKEFPIEVELNVQESDDGYQVSGKSKLSFKGLEIPDPSLPLIAKVLDDINVEFSFSVGNSGMSAQ
jgi:polyisoprenoid-binding protein YceI